jgi:butyrate kinase
MTLDELKKMAKNGELDELHLVSVEGGSYAVHGVVGEQSHAVQGDDGETLHLASIDEAKKHLSSIADIPSFLVQTAVYDEMVGLASGPTHSREPVSLHKNM